MNTVQFSKFRTLSLSHRPLPSAFQRLLSSASRPLHCSLRFIAGLLLSSFLILTSCTHHALDDMALGHDLVSVTVNATSPDVSYESLTRAGLVTDATCMVLKVFNADGTQAVSIDGKTELKQTRTEAGADFGKFTGITLPAGTYIFVCVAHSYSSDIDIESPTEVALPSKPTTPVFSLVKSVTLSNTTSQVEMPLKFDVSALTIQSNDHVTSDVHKIRVTFNPDGDTPGTYSFNPSTHKASGNYSQVMTFTVTGHVGNTVPCLMYMLLDASPKTTSTQAEFLGESDAVFRTRTFTKDKSNNSIQYTIGTMTVINASLFSTDTQASASATFQQWTDNDVYYAD